MKKQKARPKSVFSVVLSTVSSADEALILARALLEKNLIACANIIPGIKSIYRWQGKVHEDNEILLIMKTATRDVPALEKVIVDLHPYDVPEIVCLSPTAVGSLYGKWVIHETMGTAVKKKGRK